MGIIEKIVVDDAVMRELEAAAELNGRTVSEEVAERLRPPVAGRPSKEELVERARQIRAMTPRDVKQTPAVQLIREDRDR